MYVTWNEREGEIMGVSMQAIRGLRGFAENVQAVPVTSTSHLRTVSVLSLSRAEREDGYSVTKTIAAVILASLLVSNISSQLVVYKFQWTACWYSFNQSCV
jgi:hypothetical protein